MIAFKLLFLLIAAHFLVDFPLQGEFMSKAKNRNVHEGQTLWFYVLPGHSIIHGTAVMLLTGSVILGMAEVWCHALIDFSKCEGWLTMRTDQGLHIICKIAWWLAATSLAGSLI